MNDLDYAVHRVLVIPLYHRKEWHYWINMMPSGIRLARSLLVIGLIGALTRHRFVKVCVKGGNGFNRNAYGSQESIVVHPVKGGFDERKRVYRF